MQASAFLRSVKADEIPPVLLLLGKETVLRRKVVGKLATLLLPGGREDAGLERIDAQEARVTAILDAAASGSLLAGHRVLVVRNAGALSAPSGSPELAALERYLDSPNPAVTLALEADSINRGHQPFKLLARRVTVIECEPLRGQTLQRAISSYARERGYALPPAAAALVEELLGNDLMMIFNALDKVMLYCGERRRIEYEDLERSLNVSREHAVWELTNALGTRDAAAALTALGRLLDEGKHPLQISAGLHYHLRTLMTVRELLDRGLPPDRVAETAGLRFGKERVFHQARLFTADELRRCLRLLFELENGIKSAGIDERFLIEDTVYKICRTGGRHAAVSGSAQ
jgi:DNA polymerase-3 subunit delta